jgi:phosphoribosyl 1,2-cyclic phosphodiesterase
LLTHTHTDHWNDNTLGHLLKRQLPLWCHPAHHRGLEGYSTGFARLKAAGLVRDYQSGVDFTAGALRCRALPVRHDSGVTFGFRLSAAGDLFGQSGAVGYAADLGCWDDTLADALADVDVLALEFNHDVALECASGRSPALIARVLGDDGHLSNDQAADLLRAVLQRSRPGRPRHVVQLHLSRECNRPALAAAAARRVLEQLSRDTDVHTAAQDQVSPTLELPASPTRPRRARRPPRAPRTAAPEPWLPGLEGG